MAILAHADNFRIVVLETIQFRFIGWNLRRTNAAERKRYKGQHHIFLAAKIRQVPVFSFARLEGEIRRDIADFQGLRFRTTICHENSILPSNQIWFIIPFEGLETFLHIYYTWALLAGITIRLARCIM